MAFDMHLKFEGGQVQIKGDSEHAKHKNEIPILAWSWGVSNAVDLHHAGGTGGGGKANVQDVSITKYVDDASSALIQACATGARTDKAYLYVTNAGGTQTDFLTLELSEGVMVSSSQAGGSGGEERLTENISLHFGQFKYSFQPQDANGAKKGGVKEFTFNMRKVAKV